MPFTKGNKLWDNPKTKSTQFKKGQRPSPKTEFKKGDVSWTKGMKGYFAGEKHYKWKFDRTQLAKRQERNDVAYQEWRKQVWQRDNFKCKMANSDCNGRIEAHHILGWTEFPELRYNLNNGITLCHAHHPRKRAEEKRLSSYFMELVSVSKV